MTVDLDVDGKTIFCCCIESFSPNLGRDLKAGLAFSKYLNRILSLLLQIKSTYVTILQRFN